jgi:hypothetical protein
MTGAAGDSSHDERALQAEISMLNRFSAPRRRSILWLILSLAMGTPSRSIPAATPIARCGVPTT